MAKKESGFELDGGWVVGFIFLFTPIWPIGLLILWNKSKSMRKSWSKKPFIRLGTVVLFWSLVMLFLEWSGAAVATALGGAALLGVGALLGKRDKRFDAYVNMVGEKPWVRVVDLASAMGCKPEETRVHLRKMLDAGMLNDRAYLDVGRDILVLDPDNAPAFETKEEPRQPEHRAAREETTAAAGASKALQDDFNEKLEMIRSLNLQIADQDVSRKIDRIEEITENIFYLVEENPDKLADIHKFMTYYLPTTFKLLTAYSRLERQSVQGGNIVASKKRIEAILDKLVSGFEQQLDLLFKSDAIDISSDINVLETMMAQDGYTGIKMDPHSSRKMELK